MSRPLCFVLMPFGKKPTGVGVVVDFDTVYQALVAPAIHEAGLEPIRDGEEVAAGNLQRSMFEHFLLCEYAVVDLTITVEVNTFYKIGARHGVHPWSTVAIFYEYTRPPLDVADLQALPYKLTNAGTPADVEHDKVALVDCLRKARKAKDKRWTDSSHFLAERFPEIASEKTDIFRERVWYSQAIKKRLKEARSKKEISSIRQIEKELSESKDGIKNHESGVLIDLLLSYRAVQDWVAMVDLVKKMPRPLAATPMVQEQFALALNRAGRGKEAEKVLNDLLEWHKPSSETYGIFGRIYKDQWEEASKSGEQCRAPELLNKAIEAYLCGFEADLRDAYLGINAVTLMELKEQPDLRRKQLLPVVVYVVEQRIAARKPNLSYTYWDYAARLEVAVLEKDVQKAKDALSHVLPLVRESWEPATTARNLRLIREARERRQETLPWMKDIERALEDKAKG
jgi:hypothetical protein